jgi:hypothetical protein
VFTSVDVRLEEKEKHFEIIYSQLSVKEINNEFFNHLRNASRGSSLKILDLNVVRQLVTSI